jgi:hypothetical protein
LLLLNISLYVNGFISVRWKLWNDTILGYRSNKLSNVNILHEWKLCSRSRMSEQSFVLVYRAYYVSTGNTLMWICEV